MKRSFPPSARQPLCVLVGALTTLAACSPDNDVEAGAPVLQELTLIAPGPTAVTVTADTPDCQSGLAGGEACDPSMNSLCRQNPAGWCSCVADAMDMTMGSWDCTLSRCSGSWPSSIGCSTPRRSTRSIPTPPSTSSRRPPAPGR